MCRVALAAALASAALLPAAVNRPALAQSPGSEVSQSSQVSPASADPAGLQAAPAETERAFDFGPARAAIRTATLAADARFLTDPALAGRPTPSAELDAVARYLVARVEALGFESGSRTGWLPTFELQRTRIDDGATQLTLASPGAAPACLQLGRDYFWTSATHLADLEVRGGLVYWGSSAEREAPLEPAQLAGCWALVSHDGTSSLRRAAERVGEAGALGMLVVEQPPALGLGEPQTQLTARKYARIASVLREPRWSPSGAQPPDSAAAAPAAPFPVVVLSSSGAAKLSARLGSFGSDSPSGGAQLPERGQRFELEISETRRALRELRAAPNVAALWPGRGVQSGLAGELIVVSAHFDHVGTPGGVLHPGADDNASGTVAVLGVAEALAAGGHLERSVLLLWVSGEELGLWGSKAWCDDPQLPAGLRAVANINLDMVGRTAGEDLYLTPTAEHEAFNRVAALALELAPDDGFGPLLGQDEYWQRSDQYSFHEHLGIPAAYLSSGDHSDYHKPSDTLERLDLDKVARVASLVCRIVAALDEETELPPAGSSADHAAPSAGADSPTESPEPTPKTAREER